MVEVGGAVHHPSDLDAIIASDGAIDDLVDVMIAPSRLLITGVVATPPVAHDAGDQASWGLGGDPDIERMAVPHDPWHIVAARVQMGKGRLSWL